MVYEEPPPVSPDAVSIIGRRDWQGGNYPLDVVVAYDGRKLIFEDDGITVMPWLIRPEVLLRDLTAMLDNAVASTSWVYVNTTLPYGGYAIWSPAEGAYQFGCTRFKLADLRRAAEEIERRWCAASPMSQPQDR